MNLSESLYQILSASCFAQAGNNDLIHSYINTSMKLVLTHPQVVHHLACPLEIWGNVLSKVLVEARLHWKYPWKRGPVIFFGCKQRFV